MLRFMAGEDPKDPTTKSRNQQLIEEENHYFVVVGTDQGRLYSFNPRNIDLTYTFFTLVKHSSGVTSDPLKQI